ncbi:hypothetical protein [Shewanella halifaxensis]|uniref:hypothetical protein n=1 Tax=Shewanella halifaxensis TaxID=271098 RepID=UPI000D594EAF|nr:hypothetical protein [Shewanella halifaxensis]
MEDLSKYIGAGKAVEFVNLVGAGMNPADGLTYEQRALSATESSHIVRGISDGQVMIHTLSTTLNKKVFLTKLIIDGEVIHSGKADIGSSLNSPENSGNKFSTLLQSGLIKGKLVEMKLVAIDSNQKFHIGWSDIK